MASSSGMHALPFKHAEPSGDPAVDAILNLADQTDKLQGPVPAQPKPDKTWIVEGPHDNSHECGSLQGARSMAVIEARRYPGSRIVVYEAIEVYRVPHAPVEVEKL
jgi:hypothetical protein